MQFIADLNPLIHTDQPSIFSVRFEIHLNFGDWNNLCWTFCVKDRENIWWENVSMQSKNIMSSLLSTQHRAQSNRLRIWFAFILEREYLCSDLYNVPFSINELQKNYGWTKRWCAVQKSQKERILIPAKETTAKHFFPTITYTTWINHIFTSWMIYKMFIFSLRDCQKCSANITKNENMSTRLFTYFFFSSWHF